MGKSGKSSFISQFVKGNYNQEYSKTLAPNFKEKRLTLDDRTIIIHLWDTAGEINTSYYKDAKAAIIMFSISDLESFNQIPLILQKVKKHTDLI